MTVDVVDDRTGEVVPYPSWAGGPLTPEETKARAVWVRAVTKAALTENVDYGIIPGTQSQTLLKPGAEMLLLAAGLGFTEQRIDDEDSRAHRGVTYKVTVHRGDLTVSQCDGYAGYDESRFFISAADAEKRERANAERYKRAPRSERFVEYRAPWNSIVKMAQKRALVGAALNAVAGSGLFIDPDDLAGGGDEGSGRGGGRGRGRGRRTDTEQSGASSSPAPEAAALVERETALSEGNKSVFKEWRESRNMPWPATSAAVIKQAAKELDRLEADQAAGGAATGGEPSEPRRPSGPEPPYEPPVGSPID